MTESALRLAYTSSDRTRRGRERGLDDRHHGRDAAAAGERDDRDVGRSCSTNSPVGRITSMRVARRDRVVHPVRHASAGHALDRGRERLADVGRARHRVAAHDRLAGDRRRGTCRTARPTYAERALRARAGRRGRTTACRRSRRRRRRPPARGSSWSGSSICDPRVGGLAAMIMPSLVFCKRAFRIG